LQPGFNFLLVMWKLSFTFGALKTETCRYPEEFGERAQHNADDTYALEAAKE